MNNSAYDLIGDIHGHAVELESLLKKLGYKDTKGIYRHPERKVIFLGDYIDRGPKIKEVLRIVRAMVEHGEALALMGNHEYNALCWHHEDGEGGYLRPHTDKNLKQHKATLKAFQDSPLEWKEYLRWFLSLPLFLEQEAFRAVHASWVPAQIDLLRRQLAEGLLDENTLKRSTGEDMELKKAVDEVLKGPELLLPEGVTFKDKDDHVRSEIRIRWWEDPRGITYKQYSVVELKGMKDRTVVSAEDAWYYGRDERPVFFGHYWLKHPHPAIMHNNICCLDHSVAKEGHLMAYRFDGEQVLDPRKLVSVLSVDHPRSKAAGSTA